MSASVVAENLVKRYGPRLALRGVSFAIEPGEVVGVLGPNGSGKSTLFRILTGYLAPSAGTALVAGHDATTGSLALRREIGYVPEDAPLYDQMRVSEFLRFMARLKGLAGGAVGRSIDAVAARLELERVMGTAVAKLSRGFRQRVAIAQALLGEPKLLVLDEPTSGLDPSQVIAVRDLIGELAGRQTVLIASHVLSEIDRIASRVMILLDGVLLTTDALRQHGGRQNLRLTTSAPEAAVRAAIDRLPGVRSISGAQRDRDGAARYVVEAEPRPRLAEELAAALAARSLPFSELASVPPDLEQIFLDLTRRGREAAA